MVRNQSSRAARIAPRSAVGIVAIAAAVAIRLPLEPILQGRNDFILLEPAIAVAAWYGGFVSGTIATVAAVVASALLYLSPAQRADLMASGDLLSLALFSINGLLLTTLSAGLRRAYERATDARLKAEVSAARSERLQRIALALNRPMSTQGLAQTAIVQAIDLLGAFGGLVAVGRASDAELRVLATHGYTGAVGPGAAVGSGLESPLGDVMRGREPIFLRSRAERQARYPSVATQFAMEGDSLVLPLLYQEVAVGALYLNFNGVCGYGPDDREFLLSIGIQCGSALERAVLIERSDALAATEQARAAELSTVLEAIGEGLLVGDADGRVILANPAVERLLGKVPASLAALPDRAADAAEAPASSDRFLARSPVRPLGWLEIARFPVAAGSGPSSDVVLIRDVTAAVEADLQRDAFLGVLSHELRTPITTIMGAVALLRRSEVATDEQSRGLLGDLDAEATRLHRIVEDLLVLTRSERGALDVSGEPVLVHRIVRSVVERARLGAPDVEIRLVTTDDLSPVEAEPTYVQQIVRNFLSNALKYGRAPGQPIEVVVSQGRDAIETRVLDRGVGFGPGDAERLFTLFYRNPKAIASAPGAGIGLYVCRLLAEAMGGRTWARSRAGGGAEFGFALPRMADLDAPTAAPDGRTSAGARTSAGGKETPEAIEAGEV
jgi:K+-sensing histidine kinase KdpD